MVKARQRAFMRVFAEVGNVTRAAAIVGVSRRIHYVWLDRDPEYALEFERVRERAYDLLRDEAVRRAMGYSVPVYHHGVKVGTRKKYSDTSLMFLLKETFPEKYGELTPSRKARRRAKTVVVSNTICSVIRRDGAIAFDNPDY